MKNRNFLGGYHFWIPLFFLIVAFQKQGMQEAANPVTIKIIFENEIKGSPVVLNDSTYINPFNEKYTISKLRYYVTNLFLQNGQDKVYEPNSYHLIDQGIPQTQSIFFSVPPGEYNSINFLLGVDSLHNVSGAQTDDLDPAKDMFWTWNSGYVMAKMEGISPASKLVNHKFAYHIGGFAGIYNVLKKIKLNFQQNSMDFTEGKNYEIIIQADIDSWWQHPYDITISEKANITSPGESALHISDNYAKMFSIKKIVSD